MYETAKLLVEIAMRTHMKQFNVSWEIAGYWIRSAAEGAKHRVCEADHGSTNRKRKAPSTVILNSVA